MLHGWPRLTLATKVKLTLKSSVILMRVVVRIHPRIGRGRSRRQPEEIIGDNVSVVLEYNLWNWHDLLLMADHALLILTLCRLAGGCRILLLSTIFLGCRGRVGTFRLPLIFLLLLGCFAIRDV
jgi:hypothetical protein